MKKTLLLFLTMGLLVSGALGQANILEARSYAVGQSVTVTGIVLNGAEMGSSVRYIQDETAGIAIYPGASWTNFTAPVTGDEITVTGVLTEYNGLLEVGPNLTSVVTISTGNTLPAPAVITPNEMDESYEGQLVIFDGAQFDNGGSLISGSSSYGFTAAGQAGEAYIRNGSVLVGTNLPAGVISLIGIASQFSFSGVGGYQLLPRDENDFVLSSGINIYGQVVQSNLAQTSFTLSWNTDNAGNSMVEYGPTPDLGMSASDATSTTAHSIDLTNLTPGTVYWARVGSSNGEEETWSTIFPYATVSESSGDITVYFTQLPATEYASLEEAIGLPGAVDDTIAAYISRATATIDIAMYNFGDPTIRAALNAAYAEGIQIRFVGEGSNSNLEVDNLDPGIPTHFRTDGLGSGNHNKFMVIDRDDADRAIVLTGSTNWIDQDEFSDFNNIIIFQDQSLARAYTIEFEEMWGSNTMEPDPGNSRFGADKLNNTPKKFIVGGSAVEVYFSPSDNTNQAILDAIGTTDSELYYMIFSFTRDDIRDAIIDEDDLFLTTVRGLMESTSDPSSEYQPLVDAGMEVYSHEGVAGQLHHKTLIVDQGNASSDPILLTGSHNWSNSANSINDENTVVVHDQRVANLYYQEFMARLLMVNISEASSDEMMDVYPNPADAQFVVGLPSNAGRADLIIRDMQGREVLRQTLNSQVSVVDGGMLPAGVYFCEVNADSDRWVRRIVIR